MRPLFCVEQCRAKAAELLAAARRAAYFDRKRLYEEIAEQWLSIADELERQTREDTAFKLAIEQFEVQPAWRNRLFAIREG
jgi:hypothetical protein